MSQFHLAPHVHLALVDDDLVFLDATRDEYLCVSRRHKKAVLAALSRPTRLSPILAELQEAGLLVTKAAGMPWPGTLPKTARTDFDPQVDPPAISIRDVAALAVAAVRTWIDLRFGRPATWFARQARRNARGARPTSADELIRSARLLARLRPLVPRSGRCLARSLLLLHMLALRGLRAEWIIGVRTHPFNAHCWIEHDGIVLNDACEHARWYTPIVRL